MTFRVRRINKFSFHLCAVPLTAKRCFPACKERCEYLVKSRLNIIEYYIFTRVKRRLNILPFKNRYMPNYLKSYNICIYVILLFYLNENLNCLTKTTFRAPESTPPKTFKVT